MNSFEWLILVIFVVCVFSVSYQTGHDSGMQEGVAYQKCIDELGYDCTEQAVEEIYLPVEKEIDEYVYPLKLHTEVECSEPSLESSEEYWIITGERKQIIEHTTVYEEDSVYYDTFLEHFVHLRSKTSTGWMAGFSKYFGDSKTTISTIPITDEYMQANLEFVEAVTDYAIYTDVAWYARDKLNREVSKLGEKETYAEVDSACLNNEFMGVLICYNSTLGASEIIYLDSS